MKYRLSKYITPYFNTDNKMAEWGGYYNYPFLSYDNSLLLCNRTNIEGKAVKQGDMCEVGYYDISNNEWHGMGVSDSFNWQQATNLQWVNTDRKDRIVYNKTENGHYVSEIINIANGGKKTLCYPVYGLTPDGKYAICLNYERAYWTVAYHYQSIENKECDLSIVPGDGIYRLEIDTNKLDLLISIEKIAALEMDFSFSSNCSHWVEHIMINKEGTKFVFLHRFSYPGCERRTRIIISDIEGSNLKVVPGWDRYSWSHFGWIDETSFAIYSVPSNLPSFHESQGDVITAKRKSLKSFIKCVIPEHLKWLARTNGYGYQIYCLDDDRYVLKDIISKGPFRRDGHPSFAKNGRYMITSISRS